MALLLEHSIRLRASLQPTPQIHQGAGSDLHPELCCIQCCPVSNPTHNPTTVGLHRPTFPQSRRIGRISAYVLAHPSTSLKSKTHLLTLHAYSQLASGGDIFTSDPCVNLAGVDGINALLSTGGVCDQQDNADKMIDFAKSPGVQNQDALIAAAIAYRQHPRNAEDIGGGVIPSVPYCTKQPRNQELVGVVNEQLPGVNPGLFGGPNSPVVAFGAGKSHCLFMMVLLRLMDRSRWHLPSRPDTGRFDLFLRMKLKHLLSFCSRSRLTRVSLVSFS